MALRRLILASLFVVMIAGACTRQASEPIDVVSEAQLDDSAATVIPADPTDAPTVPADDDAATATDSPPPTETPPIVAITSTPIVPQAAGPTEAEPTATITADVPTATAFVPSETPAAAIPVFTSTPLFQTGTPSGSTNVVPMVSETPLVSMTQPVITPGVPGGGQSAITTPTPRLDATNTPSGLITPTDGFTQPDSVEATPPVDENCIYVVQRGDTLFRIAINNDTTVDAMTQANPDITPELIQPGDELIIPDCDAEETAGPTALPSPTGETGDDNSGVTGAVPLEGEEEDQDQGIITGVENIHVVAEGETLGAIARRYNVTIQAIINANNLSNPNRLSIGQELVIPPPED